MDLQPIDRPLELNTVGEPKLILVPDMVPTIAVP